MQISILDAMRSASNSNHEFYFVQCQITELRIRSQHLGAIDSAHGVLEYPAAAMVDAAYIAPTLGHVRGVIPLEVDP
jgi:hypothetical protein